MHEPVDTSGRVVSVVIPAFNAATYLRETVSAALASELVGKVIIVDDGSTDNTAEILRELQATNLRVAVITQLNQGLSAARNSGFHAVETEFTCFVDADDNLLPHGLFELYRVLAGSAEAVAVYGQVDYIGERSQYLKLTRPRRPAQKIGLEDVLQAAFIDTIGAMLFRTSAISLAGLFDQSLRFAEDWEFYTRLVILGPILPLQQSVVQYRQHTQSMMHGPQLNLKAFEAAIEKVYASTGPGTGHIDPTTLKKFEWRKRASILRRLGHRRQKISTHLRILTKLLSIVMASRYDRVVVGLCARAVLTAGKRIMLRA